MCFTANWRLSYVFRPLSLPKGCSGNMKGFLKPVASAYVFLWLLQPSECFQVAKKNGVHFLSKNKKWCFHAFKRQSSLPKLIYRFNLIVYRKKVLVACSLRMSFMAWRGKVVFFFSSFQNLPFLATYRWSLFNTDGQAAGLFLSPCLRCLFLYYLEVSFWILEADFCSDSFCCPFLFCGLCCLLDCLATCGWSLVLLVSENLSCVMCRNQSHLGQMVLDTDGCLIVKYLF